MVRQVWEVWKKNWFQNNRINMKIINTSATLLPRWKLCKIYTFIMQQYYLFSLSWLKRLWEQWTQHTVRGAFRPTILPVEKSARELRAWLCLRKSNPGRDLNPGPWGLGHSTHDYFHTLSSLLSAYPFHRDWPKSDLLRTFPILGAHRHATQILLHATFRQ